jgi:intracellular multiplication protein IcmL
MGSNDALVWIISRNDFYRRLHLLVLGAFFLNILVIISLIFTLGYLLKNPVKPLYFAADDVGRLIHIIPVNVPNMPTENVTAWTVKAVQDAFSYDYINYHGQLQDVEKYFTRYGWNKYMKALRDSNNLLALTNRKQVVLAQVISPPKLLMEGLLSGAYAWQFEMPLLVIYTMPPYDGSNQFSNALNVSVVVQRQNILEGESGLGIVQLISAMPVANTTQMQQ